MKAETVKFQDEWRVIFKNRRAEAAEMTIQPGKREGSARNSHSDADQWIFIVDGVGTASIDGERFPLQRGTLILIEANEKHEIRNTGTDPLRTLNWYAPPAYDLDGEPLPAGKPDT